MLCSYAVIVCFQFKLKWNDFLIHFIFCFVPALGVFEEALNYFRSSAPELKEERAMLLEKWLNMEASSGELGDVSLVQSKLPKKLKKRRQVTTEDGSTRCVTHSLFIFSVGPKGWLIWFHMQHGHSYRVDLCSLCLHI